jgi:hypothetical protein
MLSVDSGLVQGRIITANIIATLAKKK